MRISPIPPSSAERASPASGITLIELIVTLAIVAVAITVVGPSVGAVVDGVRLASLANELASEARHARSLAETSGRTVWMTFSDEEIRIARGEAEERRMEIPPNVRISTHSAAVMFLPTGQVVGPERIELRTTAGRVEALVRDPVSGNLRRNDPTGDNP